MIRGEPRVPDARPSAWAAFAYRDFALLWGGLLVSNLGTWMQFTALGYYVASLAPDARVGALDIGLIGAARAVPVLLLSPFAGVVADRYPRRRVLFITNSMTSLLSFSLFALVATAHAPLWTLMIVSALQAGTQSFDAPARQSWVPLMVPREFVGGAIGLNSVAFNAPSVVGPPLAGLLIAGIGVAPCFLVNAATTLAVLAALSFMKPAPPSSRRRGNVVEAIVEGVRFLIGHPVLRWVVLLLVVTSLTIRPYNFLLPAYALHVVHTNALGLGWLMAASGAGAICGAFFTAASGDDRRGIIWAVSAVVAAAGVAALGLTSHLGVAAAILGVVGLATLSFIGSSNILLQTLAPDEMRGRVVSVYSMILLGLVPLGSLIVGSIAAVFELRWTFVAAGLLACAIALGVAFTQPEVRDA
ncbi:MAG: permease of the major facilitator superfamily [Candidatus Eremiobacteraeota bacterium]|nr:permease of the major facilitator superfamily [Candidatus Eremiobacteraeota bacterium]